MLKLTWPNLTFPPINLYSMARNDITGDKLINKKNTDKYRENHDRIFIEKSTDGNSKFEKITIRGITTYKLKIDK